MTLKWGISELEVPLCRWGALTASIDILIRMALSYQPVKGASILSKRLEATSE
jgi:hypothetical protein